MSLRGRSTLMQCWRVMSSNLLNDMENILRNLLISAPIAITLMGILIYSFTKIKSDKRTSLFLLLGSVFGGICIIFRVLSSPVFQFVLENDWTRENVQWVIGIYHFTNNLLMSACLIFFVMSAVKRKPSESPPVLNA